MPHDATTNTAAQDTTTLPSSSGLDLPGCCGHDATSQPLDDVVLNRNCSLKVWNNTSAPRLHSASTVMSFPLSARGRLTWKTFCATDVLGTRSNDKSNLSPAIAGFRVQGADRYTTRSIVKMTIVPNEHTVLSLCSISRTIRALG